MHASLATPTESLTESDVFAVRHSALDPCTSLLVITGELDLAAAPALKGSLGAWLEGRTFGDLVVEVSGVTHVDSTGLAVLIAFRRRLPNGSRVALAAPSEHVIRLLALTGLDRAFAVYPTVDAARAELSRARRSDDALPLTPDAAVAVGLAFTALLFAECPAAEAERWARILLPYGDTELVAELVDCETGPGEPAATGSRPAGEGARERLEQVVSHATLLATERGRGGVGTGDLAGGVVAVYGPAFGRALQAQL